MAIFYPLTAGELVAYAQFPQVFITVKDIELLVFSIKLHCLYGHMMQQKANALSVGIFSGKHVTLPEQLSSAW